MGSVNWRKRGNRYQVAWRLDDGSQGAKTVATKDEALDLVAEKRLEMSRSTWQGRRRGRLPFSQWDTPEEAGRLLASCPLFWWDHVLALLGTGLRFGEFAGLRRRRVHLDRIPPVLQVVDVRYQAGRFGSGYRPRPKSDAGIREIPLAPLVIEAIRSQLPPGAGPDALVFSGPGGGNHVAAGTRTVLSRHGIRGMYQTAVKRADLDHLQLRGPHDFRHTFSTWLEDAGVPPRVIDELMGHQRSRHGELDGGSRIGARYRHTTAGMAARVVDAIEARLQIVLSVADEEARAAHNQKCFRVF
jgi:integrase